MPSPSLIPPCPPSRAARTLRRVGPISGGRANGPWSKRVIKIRLTRPLPREPFEEDPEAPPDSTWAIETTDGDRCLVIAGGTGTSVGNEAVNVREQATGVTSHRGATASLTRNETAESHGAASPRSRPRGTRAANSIDSYRFDQQVTGGPDPLGPEAAERAVRQPDNAPSARSVRHHMQPRPNVLLLLDL